MCCAAPPRHRYGWPSRSRQHARHPASTAARRPGAGSRECRAGPAAARNSDGAWVTGKFAQDAGAEGLGRAWMHRRYPKPALGQPIRACNSGEKAFTWSTSHRQHRTRCKPERCMLQQSLVQRMSSESETRCARPYRTVHLAVHRPSSCCTDAACASPAVRSVCLAARGTARPTSNAHSTAKAENCQGHPTYSAA